MVINFFIHEKNKQNLYILAIFELILMWLQNISYAYMYVRYRFMFVFVSLKSKQSIKNKMKFISMPCTQEYLQNFYFSRIEFIYNKIFKDLNFMYCKKVVIFVLNLFLILSVLKPRVILKFSTNSYIIVSHTFRILSAYIFCKNLRK